MKKIFSKIKGIFVMLFVAMSSLFSKAMGSGIVMERFHRVPIQSKYGIETPISMYSNTPSYIFKGIEILLIGLVFVIGIISYFKIRKIDDKEVRSVKIKHTIFTIIILLLLMVLVRLGYRFYVIKFG